MKSLLVLLSAVLYASAQECSQVTAKAAEGTGNGEGFWHLLVYTVDIDNPDLAKCSLFNAGEQCECITTQIITEEEGEPIPRYTATTYGKNVEEEGYANTSLNLISISDTQLLYRVEENGVEVFTLAIVDTDNFENWMVWADCSPDGPKALWAFTKPHVASQDLIKQFANILEELAGAADLQLGVSGQPEEDGESTCPTPNIPELMAMENKG